jgi:hypothetical protein
VHLKYFKIVAGGTPATAMATVGVPTNRKLKYFQAVEGVNYDVGFIRIK